MQTNSFLPQTFGKLEQRKRRQIPAGFNSPTIQRFPRFIRWKKYLNRQNPDTPRFFARRNYGDARKTPRRMNRDFDIRSHCHIRGQTEAQRPPR